MSWITMILLVAIIVIIAFVSSKKKSKKESVQSLLHLIIMVICADGETSEKEMAKLNQFCKKNGISEKQLQNELKAMKNVGGAQFKTAVTHEEAVKNIDVLMDFVRADGSIDENELNIVRTVAQKYGLGADYVDSLIVK